LRTAVATLEGEAEQRSADLAAALAAQTERAIEALAPPPPLAPTPVAPAMPPSPSMVTQVRPVTTVAATAVKTDVHRIVVLDDPAAWKDVRLHGIETVVLAPGDDTVARLGESAADRVLVNLAARGAFDAVLAVRAAGISVPFCGCLVPPGLARGLALGFVEVAHAPLDPDEVTTMLMPYAGRGTRVLTAGADADAFISLRQALGRQGMSVSMAWDGKQASDLLQMVRPEVVVLDLDIPPRSGVGLIVELTAAQSVPMLVLLPGRQDVGKRTAAELADAALASRLLPPDRLLDEVRRSGKPKG
jgi:CheY-like chemotaxis protein